MGTGRGADGPSKKDRREEAREKARLMREEAKRKARRRKWYLQGGIGLGVLVVLAIIALVIVTAVKPEGPGPKNMASDGILLTSPTKVVSTPAIPAGGQPTPTALTKDGVIHIREYYDYQCPYCDEFATTNDSQIEKWLSEGKITYELHPIAMLDASSLGTRYSSRAANAAACVANYDPQDYLKMHMALYANQPKEGTTGLTNSQILQILKQAGVSSSQVTSCVNNETFKGWVSAATNRALTKPLPNSSVKKLTGTPTVLVNGNLYNGSLTDASQFAQFVASQASASSTATPTPNPTPAG